MNRNKALSKQEADAKIDSQMPIGNKMDKSDIVVKNSGSKDQLEKQIVTETFPRILSILKLDR